MRDVKIKKYSKKLDYTYVFGIYPTIELLVTKPERVMKVYFSMSSYKSKEVETIRKMCEKAHIKYEVSDKYIGRVAHKENTYAMAVLQKYEEPLSPNENHVMLVNPSDMGNMGTIIRTMHAFSLFDLAIIRPGADIFDPKVIRSSMGSMFKIRFSYFYSFNEYRKHYNKHIYYPFVLNAKRNLDEVKFQKPFTLIFGNEGDGLDKTYENFDNTVKIRQDKTIDSLNLAMSAGIAMYETTFDR